MRVAGHNVDLRTLRRPANLSASRHGLGNDASPKRKDRCSTREEEPLTGKVTNDSVSDPPRGLATLKTERPDHNNDRAGKTMRGRFRVFGPNIYRSAQPEAMSVGVRMSPLLLARGDPRSLEQCRTNGVHREQASRSLHLRVECVTPMTSFLRARAVQIALAHAAYTSWSQWGLPKAALRSCHSKARARRVHTPQWHQTMHE